VVRPGGDRSWRVGHDQIDEFLEFAHGRARPATVRAYAHDLMVFFSIVEKDPVEVRSRDVLALVSAEQRPRPGAENVVRISDGGVGLSASTIKIRLAAVSSLFGYLVVGGEVAANPVPRGLPTRKSRHRDRGTVQAMLLGGLRRCEVLGLRLEDLRLGEWRVFIAEGKGGHPRLVPVSQTFFATVARYLNDERPAQASTDRVFVALKGPTRGGPLSVEGLDEMLANARGRAGWRTAPATSCATRASPGCEKAAWRSRRSRPRPVTARSRRHASSCTSAPTGSPASTSALPRRSRPKPRWERRDEPGPRCCPGALTRPADGSAEEAVHVGRDLRPGAAHGRDDGALSRPAPGVGAAVDAERL
jgi:site-specific recombinase XerD